MRRLLCEVGLLHDSDRYNPVALRSQVFHQNWLLVLWLSIRHNDAVRGSRGWQLQIFLVLHREKP